MDCVLSVNSLKSKYCCSGECSSCWNKKCTVRCSCYGSCNNSNLMNDILFFKVWRNIVLRNLITGPIKLQIINQKSEIMEMVIGKLNYYEIQYNRKIIFDEIKNLNKIIDKEVIQIVEEIFKPYATQKMDLKQREMLNLMGFRNIIYRPNRKSVYDYFETIDPMIEKTLPTLNEIIEAEKEEIDSILENIKIIYEEHDMEFDASDSLIIKFITNCSDDYGSLINEEINRTYERKKALVERELEFYNIVNPRYQDEIDKYLYTYKRSELVNNDVWSIRKIIFEEKKALHVENASTIKKKLLIAELKNQGLPYRNNSELNINFIQAPPPLEIISTLSSENEQNEEYIDLSDTLNLLYIFSIEEVVKKEKELIQTIVNTIESQFIANGLEFDISSEKIQGFIENSPTTIDDSFKGKLASLISIEKYYQMAIKLCEFNNQLKINGITNPKYFEQHSKYRNSIDPSYKKDEFPSSPFSTKTTANNDQIWSPETIIKKELEAKSRIDFLKISFFKAGINYEPNEAKSLIINYIYNRDENGNELSAENSNNLLNEIIQDETLIILQKREEEEDDDDEEFDEDDDEENDQKDEEEIYYDDVHYFESSYGEIIYSDNDFE
ncbi:hypothetical protein ACTA71_009274 [Dictyostelium dimigraforme]